MSARCTWLVLVTLGLGCAPLRLRTPGLTAAGPQCVSPIVRSVAGQADAPELAAEAVRALSLLLGARSLACGTGGLERVEVWARTRTAGPWTAEVVLGARAVAAGGPLWEREFAASSTQASAAPEELERRALREALEEFRRFASLDPSAGRVFMLPPEVMRTRVRSWFKTFSVELEDGAAGMLVSPSARVLLVPVDAQRTLLEVFSNDERDRATEAKLAELFDFEASGGLPELGMILDVEPLPAFAPLTGSLKAASPATPVPPTALEEACGVRVADVNDLAPGRVLLLPDLEGSQQTPQVVERAVCAALQLGREVTVALDIDSSEQARINTFLSSNGTPPDRAMLTAGKFWNRIWQDGRSSVAIGELLERLRAWRHEGRPVRVLAMDWPVPGNPRAARMSARLLAHHHAAPSAVIIGYTSNTLGRLVLSDDLPAFQPLGYRLVAAGLQVSAWDVSFNTGKRWTCHLFGRDLLHCGTWPVSPGDASDNDVRHSTTVFWRHPGAHSGSVCVGEISPSPPATGDQTDEGQAYSRHD